MISKKKILRAGGNNYKNNSEKKGGANFFKGYQLAPDYGVYNLKIN